MNRDPIDGDYDLVLANGRVIDPASKLDGRADVAIKSGRIARVGANLVAAPGVRRIDLDGALVTPGFVDMHVHVYEWVTNFGVPADSAGIHSGATTIVDQGSSGCWTFGGFKRYVVEPAQTDVRAFVSINVAGALKGGSEGTTLHNPDMVNVPDLVACAKANPRIVRGFKCHGESGSYSHWELEVLSKAAEAGQETGLPLYMHTGELFPVNEPTRPDAAKVVAAALSKLKAGDIMAHIYSCMPDGIVGQHPGVPDVIHAAREKGVLFDLGHGINFSFRLARRLMEAGILADTIGSDVHGDFCSYHDFRILDYSLVGGLNKLLALGMPLMHAVGALTCAPARILKDDSIGRLAPGCRANVTVLEKIDGPWSYTDAEGEVLKVTSRLVPSLVVMDGDEVSPDCGLLADMLEPAERPRFVTRRPLTRAAVRA